MGSTQVLIFEVPKGKAETWETSQMVQSQTDPDIGSIHWI